MFHVVALPHLGSPGSGYARESLNSERRRRVQALRFQRFQPHSAGIARRPRGGLRELRADFLKSTMRCLGGFHRFQRIRAGRFTLSTAGLYDLYTRYGQIVDKKALLLDLGNYPQVPPQPEGPLYRGFQVHKSFKNQSDNSFFHEIWAYHHHHALDLYPDLEARPALIRPQPGLWTVTSAEEATAALRPAICLMHPASWGT